MVTLTRSFFIGFLPNVIYELLPSNSPKFEYGRCGTNDNQDGQQYGPACRFALVDTLSHLFGFCPMNHNQDARPLLSVCTCGHANLLIYHPGASKFHIWITFFKHSPKFEWVLSDNQDGLPNWLPPVCLHLWTFFLSLINDITTGKWIHRSKHIAVSIQGSLVANVVVSHICLVHKALNDCETLDIC